MEPQLKEESTFLEVDGSRVFTTLCIPQSPNGRAVVLCHPLGEEKLWAHRPLVTFSRDLASHGFTVSRFDCRGEGDSDCQFEEVDLETRVADVGAVVGATKRACRDVSDVSLVGLRFGALLAALAASRLNDVDRLVMWDPVIDGEPYAQSLLRINLAAQLAAYKKVVEGRERLLERMAGGGTVNIEGYGLTGSFVRQVSSIRLADQIAACPGRLLVLQPGPEGAAPRPDIGRLQAARPDATVRIVPEQPFWKETKTFFQRADAFSSATVEWLEAAE
jgi:pimeloyl-ACP methyl ester carboxylesterase